mgnify:CR=1 FL=1
MERVLAEQLIEGLKKCRTAIDEVEIISRQIPDEQFRKAFLYELGTVSLDLYSKAMGMIILDFPELDPYPHRRSSP